MSLADDLRKSVVSVAGLAAEQIGRGASAFNQWATDRDIDDRLEKAATQAKTSGRDGTHDINEAIEAGRKSFNFDPFDVVAAMGYRDRPSSLSYAAMDRVARSVPVIADIVQTRTNQVVMFCERPNGRHMTGFKAQPRDKAEQKKNTRAMRKRAAELEDLVLHTGQFDRNNPAASTSFETFARMFVFDTFAFDQVTFEIVSDRRGKPAYLAMVDPATIRLLDPGFRSSGDAFAVQVINGSIVADFKRDELAFIIRNSRSGIKSYGYGVSEVETLVREITGILWAMDYNRKFFTQGSAARGVLNFKGSIPDKHLKAFRRQWYAMMSGVANAWRTPITNAEELQWVNMQLSNRDMEYSAWFDFLIKISCARFNISTEEVQFSYGNTGQSSAMGQAPIAEKIKASKDLGLRPLVKKLFESINLHFLQRLDPDFEVIPVGLDEIGEEAETELLQKKGQSYLTLDEVRAYAGEDPVGEEGGGHIIMNPTWLQWKQSADMMKQQQEMGGMGGDLNDPNAQDGQQPPDDGAFNIDDPGQNVDVPDAGDQPADSGEADDVAIKSIRDRVPLARFTVNID